MGDMCRNCGRQRSEHVGVAFNHQMCPTAFFEVDMRSRADASRVPASLEFIGFPKMARLSRECVITEKIDGTNAQVYIGLQSEWPSIPVIAANDGMFMLAGSRTRWITPTDDNFGFARWVQDNAAELFKLGPGQHFGEWWGGKIQRGYGLKEKRFSLFNTTRWNEENKPACCHVVPELYRGKFNQAVIEGSLMGLAEGGSKAAPGFMDPEGIVIYHTAASVMFKKTIKDDEKPKGQKDA